ncbi:uncharacterized protein LOC136039870 isoform X1 [Artemia franciscana]|uniref:uncharacterized protein LOC136039870 isoform X1 n=1 Tax=Artemia franciscana TaxID=6661 RepID=UPI0032DB2798
MGNMSFVQVFVFAILAISSGRSLPIFEDILSSNDIQILSPTLSSGALEIDDVQVRLSDIIKEDSESSKVDIGIPTTESPVELKDIQAETDLYSAEEANSEVDTFPLVKDSHVSQNTENWKTFDKTHLFNVFNTVEQQPYNQPLNPYHSLYQPILTPQYSHSYQQPTYRTSFPQLFPQLSLQQPSYQTYRQQPKKPLIIHFIQIPQAGQPQSALQLPHELVISTEQLGQHNLHQPTYLF